MSGNERVSPWFAVRDRRYRIGAQGILKALAGTRSLALNLECGGQASRPQKAVCFTAMPAARAIDVDDLWRVAARKVRASPNPPQDVYVDGLRCLASALQVPGRYDEPALRLLQRELFVRILADLSVSRDIAANPEIAEIPVRRPLLITGFGRTGSTLLHNLLALDPHARAPLLWELLGSVSPAASRDRGLRSAHRERAAAAGCIYGV